MTDKLPETGAVSSGGRNGHMGDPSPNVLDLVEAAVKRLNDVGSAQDKRQDDLREAESRHVRQIMDLTTFHAEKMQSLVTKYETDLRVAESNRIDAIRLVDVNAVAVAADRQTQVANVLAAKVQESADALRSQIGLTATATAASLAQTINPIIDRIAELEKKQYQEAGKSGVTDPQIAMLVAEVKATRGDLLLVAGAKKGASDSKTDAFDTTKLVLAGIAGFFGLISVVGTIVGTVVLLTR